MKTSSLDGFAGWAALLAAAIGLLYSVAFVVLQNPLLYSVCLMVGGLLSLLVMTALFQRLSATDAALARLGWLLGAAAALGATIHGGYDLANVLNPPGELPAAVAALPSQVDPRGLLTFGLAGLAVLIAAQIMRSDPGFSRGFTALTFLLGALLLVVYLGRLIVLSPANPLVLLPAALTGFLLNPVWYFLLGMRLRASTAHYEATPTAASVQPTLR